MLKVGETLPARRGSPERTVTSARPFGWCVSLAIAAFAFAAVLACSPLAREAGGGPVASPPTSAIVAASDSSAAACAGKDPRQHIYHPDRLVLRDPCKTVRGVVATIRREPDGDYHIGLQLDAGQEQLLNAKNISEQSGHLILEIICANPVTQVDAIGACAGYANSVPVPTVGAHISVTGPYVLDLDHGWFEVHPVWAIGAVTGTSTTSEPTSVPTAEAPTNAPALATGTRGPASSSSTDASILSVSITTSRYGSVAATTLPGASCSASARLPSGSISAAQGLAVIKTADPSGGVAWSYGTTSRTTPGTGTHTVTCSMQGQTQAASAPFSVP